MKMCKKCKKTYSEESFHNDKAKLDGKRNICKHCDTDSCRKYREKNRERMRKYRKSYYSKHKEETRKSNRKSRERNMAVCLISSARNRAKKKEVPFDLDQYKKQLTDRMNVGICELTGIILDRTAKKTYNSPSLDRINPDSGYVYQNVRIVCYGINCALGTWGEKKLRYMAKKLLER